MGFFSPGLSSGSTQVAKAPERRLGGFGLSLVTSTNAKWEFDPPEKWWDQLGNDQKACFTVPGSCIFSTFLNPLLCFCWFQPMRQTTAPTAAPLGGGRCTPGPNSLGGEMVGRFQAMEEETLGNTGEIWENIGINYGEFLVKLGRLWDIFGHIKTSWETWGDQRMLGASIKCWNIDSFRTETLGIYLPCWWQCNLKVLSNSGRMDFPRIFHDPFHKFSVKFHEFISYKVIQSRCVTGPPKSANVSRSSRDGRPRHRGGTQFLQSPSQIYQLGPPSKSWI